MDHIMRRRGWPLATGGSPVIRGRRRL